MGRVALCGRAAEGVLDEGASRAWAALAEVGAAAAQTHGADPTAPLGACTTAATSYLFLGNDPWGLGPILLWFEEPAFCWGSQISWAARRAACPACFGGSSSSGESAPSDSAQMLSCAVPPDLTPSNIHGRNRMGKTS